MKINEDLLIYGYLGCKNLGRWNASTDLDNLQVGETCFWNTSDMPANVPFKGGRCYCFQGYGTMKYQIAFYYYSDLIKVRHTWNGVWSEWGTLATQEDTNALNTRVTALEAFNTNRFVAKSYSSRNITDTGINVNGANAGKAAFIIISANYAAGDSTGAGLYLIRFGYDGNHYTATTLHENNMLIQIKPVWSITSNNTLGVTCAASGNCNLLAIIVD